MVLALRARADAAREAPGPEATESEGASAAEIRERLGEPEPAEKAASQDEPGQVAVANEPAYSAEVAQAGEGRERSLRELFWGDD
jgi:hypothetical protein